MTMTTAALPTTIAARRECTAPASGRQVLQLTEGADTCYPLYYFIPSVTADGGQLVYHRAGSGRVAMHVLDLATGTDRELYQGSTDETVWRPWCKEAGRGVYDHRSVLDPHGKRVIVFDGQQVRSVSLVDGQCQDLFQLPDDRMPIGQNCLSPDGRKLIYIHADRQLFTALFTDDGYAGYHGRRSSCVGTQLCSFDLHSGEHHVLVVINSPIHHVLPYGTDEVVFCHPTGENGMLLTDLQGGWYSHLRTQDEHGGAVCHYIATDRGLAYEILWRSDRVLGGLYDPATHWRYEFPLPTSFGYTHTGNDPEGRAWFYEQHRMQAGNEAHELWWLREHRGPDDDDWECLSGHWHCYGIGQKSHFHPQLLPGRQWILFVAGDERSESNHLHLINVSDLGDTEGIPGPP